MSEGQKPDCKLNGTYFLSTLGPKGCHVVEARSTGGPAEWMPCGLPPLAWIYFGITAENGRDLEPRACWRHLRALGDTGAGVPVYPLAAAASEPQVRHERTTDGRN